MDADGDGEADTYGRGDALEVTVTWNVDVTWDLSAPGSKMRVRLDVGGAMRGADLVAGGRTEGTARSLAFRYEVHRTDAAPDGVFPTPAADGAMVVLAGGAMLKGADGRHAHRTHAALAADPLHKVDGGREPEAAQPAAVASVALTSTPAVDADGDGAPDTYGRGETVEVTVTWDADVTWDLSAAGSTMRVRLDVGGHEKGADLVTEGPATGTARSLAFRYGVHRTDRAPDGVFPTPAADGSLVVLGGGATLRDAGGADAHRAHAALAADPGHRVDGSRTADPVTEPPAVTGVALTSTPATDTGRRWNGRHPRPQGDRRGRGDVGRGRDLGPVGAGLDDARAPRTSAARRRGRTSSLAGRRPGRRGRWRSATKSTARTGPPTGCSRRPPRTAAWWSWAGGRRSWTRRTATRRRRTRRWRRTRCTGWTARGTPPRRRRRCSGRRWCPTRARTACTGATTSSARR